LKEALERQRCKIKRLKNLCIGAGLNPDRPTKNNPSNYIKYQGMFKSKRWLLRKYDKYKGTIVSVDGEYCWVYEIEQKDRVLLENQEILQVLNKKEILVTNDGVVKRIKNAGSGWTDGQILPPVYCKKEGTYQYIDTRRTKKTVNSYNVVDIKIIDNIDEFQDALENGFSLKNLQKDEPKDNPTGRCMSCNKPVEGKRRYCKDCILKRLAEQRAERRKVATPILRIKGSPPRAHQR